MNTHLPWAWFAALGLLDVGLAAVAVERRRNQGRAVRARREAEAQQSVVCHGWRVPSSRLAGLAGRPGGAEWQWALHREVLSRSVHPTAACSRAL